MTAGATMAGRARGRACATRARSTGMSRSDFLRRGAGAVAAGLLAARLPAGARTGAASMTAMNTRPIPSTDEPLPVIGCGTWQTFDVGPSPDDRGQRARVLDTLFGAGGSVIDSSPMYGRSEQVVGDLLAAAEQRERAFLATKVWTSGRAEGIAQMERSLARLRSGHIDLMQVHNLVDWQVHLETLRDWKAQGRVRYVGVTHYTRSAYARLESVMRGESLDFVQFNYSVEEREAEQRLLPLAAERRIAVLVNLPFGGGGLLRGLAGKPLPGFAAEIDCTSWAQLLLKFVLSNPAVSCVIPGTSRPEHMADNARAGTGEYPDAALRKRIVEAVRRA